MIEEWEREEKEISEKATWTKNPVRMFIYTVFGIAFIVVWVLFFLEVFGIVDFFDSRVGNYPPY